MGAGSCAIDCEPQEALDGQRFQAYRNFCGALDWFSLSVGGVGVSRGGVEFVPVDVCVQLVVAGLVTMIFRV